LQKAPDGGTRGLLRFPRPQPGCLRPAGGRKEAGASLHGYARMVAERTFAVVGLEAHLFRTPRGVRARRKSGRRFADYVASGPRLAPFPPVWFVGEAGGP